jgi:hypothetical protein
LDLAGSSPSSQETEFSLCSLLLSVLKRFISSYLRKRAMSGKIQRRWRRDVSIYHIPLDASTRGWAVSRDSYRASALE